jgi:hypothetical protein
MKKKSGGMLSFLSKNFNLIFFGGIDCKIVIGWNLFKYFSCNYFIFNNNNNLKKEIEGNVGISFQNS